MVVVVVVVVVVAAAAVDACACGLCGQCADVSINEEVPRVPWHGFVFH